MNKKIQKILQEYVFKYEKYLNTFI